MAQFQWKPGFIWIQTFPLPISQPVAPFGSSRVKFPCLFLSFSYFTFSLENPVMPHAAWNRSDRFFSKLVTGSGSEPSGSSPFPLPWPAPACSACFFGKEGWGKRSSFTGGDKLVVASPSPAIPPREAHAGSRLCLFQPQQQLAQPQSIAVQHSFLHVRAGSKRCPEIDGFVLLLLCCVPPRRGAGAAGESHCSRDATRCSAWEPRSRSRPRGAAAVGGRM